MRWIIEVRSENLDKYHESVVRGIVSFQVGGESENGSSLFSHFICDLFLAQRLVTELTKRITRN